jgi:hypothetical protein
MKTIVKKRDVCCEVVIHKNLLLQNAIYNLRVSFLLVFAMRLWLKFLIAFVVVTSSGIVLDRLLLREGVTRQDLVILSDLLVGLIGAVLVYVIAEEQDRRAHFVQSRLAVIEQMNHHIRNALQVIAYHSWSGKNQQEMATIEQAVDRITWSLREILPRILPEDVPPIGLYKEPRNGDQTRADHRDIDEKSGHAATR